MTDVRILAVDQRVNENNVKAAVGRTVTIEVTPKQAEVMAVATNLGRLSLTLRSLAKEQRFQEGIITAGATVLDLEELAKRPPKRGRSHTFDSQTSRLLATPTNTDNVLIVRGGKRTSIRFPKVR